MENVVLNSLLTRRSVRKFTEEKISVDIMTQIIAAGQQAPSSINGQQISLIVIEDREKLTKLGDLCGGQPHIKNAAAFIVVVVDFHRVAAGVEIAGAELGVTDSIEGLMYGAIDSGITVEALATAAESFGIGTTVIGALRGNLQGVIDLCQLPAHTVPLVGLTMGYPNKDELPYIKPRIPVAAYAFNETYPATIDFKKYFADYEQTMEDFRKKSGQAEIEYTTKIAKAYSKTSPKRDTAAIYEKQGFKLK